MTRFAWERAGGGAVHGVVVELTQALYDALGGAEARRETLVETWLPYLPAGTEAVRLAREVEAQRYWLLVWGEALPEVPEGTPYPVARLRGRRLVMEMQL